MRDDTQPTRSFISTSWAPQMQFMTKEHQSAASMPQLKIQDGVALLDAQFNGSFVLQCVACLRKRHLALGPPTIPFPSCSMCGGSSACVLQQRLGVVFVNLIDRGNQIVRLDSHVTFSFAYIGNSTSRFFRRLAIALPSPIILQTVCRSAAACTGCKPA